MAKTRKEAFLELIEKKRALEKLSNAFEKTKAEHVDVFSSIKIGDELVHRSGRLMKIYLVKITDVFKDGVKITAYPKSSLPTIFKRKMMMSSKKILRNGLMPISF